MAGHVFDGRSWPLALERQVAAQHHEHDGDAVWDQWGSASLEGVACADDAGRAASGIQRSGNDRVCVRGPQRPDDPDFHQHAGQSGDPRCGAVRADRQGDRRHGRGGSAELRIRRNVGRRHPKGQAGSAVHHQLRDHQCARRVVPHPRGRPGALVRGTQLFDAHLVRHPAPRQSAADPGRCDRGDPGAERRGAGGPDRRPPDRQRPAIPDERADAGPSDHTRAVRQHRVARQSRRLPAARARCRSRQPRRPEPGHRRPPQQRAGSSDRHLSLPRGQCGAGRCPGQGQFGPLEPALPTRSQISGQLRHDHLRPGHDPRRADHARHRLCVGRDRRLRFSRQPARDPHSRNCGAGQRDRQFCRSAADGLFGQYDIAARNGAGDRHPGRRRDRRRRECRTRD